jgi:hypothetical protein
VLFLQKEEVVERIKTGLAMLVVASLMLLGLVACGGETPTPTPLPPTPTPVPPSPTPIPPTATTVTSGGSGEIATEADRELVAEALENAEALTSYHFTLDLKQTEFITQPATLEGDYMAPNVVYIKGNIGGEAVEQIAVGDDVWEKQGSDWVKREPESSDTSADPFGFNAEEIVSGGNPLEEIAGITSGVSEFSSDGEETINGVSTRKFGFVLDAEAMAGDSGMDLGDMDDLGGGTLNVDPDEQQLHKLGINLNLGPLMDLMLRGFAEAFSGTPTPGGPQPTPFPSMQIDFDMTISRHNDPSINIPLTDEMRQAMEDDETESAETPTP